MATLVVGGDGNIDVLGGRVTVAEGLEESVQAQLLPCIVRAYNDGNVDVGSLLDGLGIGARVGDDDEAGLLERAGDVVGEVTGGEATGNGDGAGVGGELEDGTLTVGTGRDNADWGSLARLPKHGLRAKFRHLEISRSLSRRKCIRTVGRVVNGSDDAGSQDNLLPGLANVQDVDTVGPGLPQVRLHVHLEVLCAEVALGSEEHLNVLLGGVEDGGEVGGSHFDGIGHDGSCLSVLEESAVVIVIVGGEREIAGCGC